MALLVDCWVPFCGADVEKSPPSRSSSPSSIVACLSLLLLKRSASSPSAAFSRSRKLAPLEVLSLVVVWPDLLSTQQVPTRCGFVSLTLVEVFQ